MSNDEGQPKEMTAEEVAYRKRLRDAIIAITEEVLKEQRDEIVRRAQLRLKFEEALKL